MDPGTANSEKNENTEKQQKKKLKTSQNKQNWLKLGNQKQPNSNNIAK